MRRSIAQRWLSGPLLCGLITVGGCASETLVVPVAPAWRKAEGQGLAEIRPPGSVLEEGRLIREKVPVRGAPVRVSDGSEVSLGSMVEARRIVGEVAAKHGLGGRTPSEAESRAGWTEVYEGEERGVVRSREVDLGRKLEVEARGWEAGRVMRELRERFGLVPSLRAAGKQ